MDRSNVRSDKLTSGPRLSGKTMEATGRPGGNEILNSIPESEYGRLRPELELVHLGNRHILHEAGERIDFAYFLNEGLASLVLLTSDGRSVEVGVVGHEGVVGTPLAVGLHRGPYRTIMQISGTAFRVRAEALEDWLEEAPELRLILHRFILIQGLQIAQIAACNRLHEIDQRLARWLLMCQDRVNSECLPVTHEFLAQMLGTGRPSVSLAAGVLQKAGTIENGRGSVKILNRSELETAACECYRAIQRFNRALVTRTAAD